MNFRDMLKMKIELDIGYELYERDNMPSAVFNLIAREKGILCGTKFVPLILQIVENELFFGTTNSAHGVVVTALKRDGDTMNPDDVLARLHGNAEVLLKAERTICNVLSELSGIATHTKEVVDSIHGSLTVLDTRKDDPLMRPAHQYAVRVGDGANHRAGISDGILIKDNDIAVYGGIKNAIEKRVSQKRHLLKVEIEVANLQELALVLEDGRVDGILLDNMSIEMLYEAAGMIRLRRNLSGNNYFIEASGVSGMDLNKVALTGVDCISLSSLIRGASYIDISMKVA